MKRLLLLVFLGSFSLHGATMQAITDAYEKSEYAKTVALCDASTTLFSSAKMQYIWAKSLEALGRDVEAMSAYERVLMLDEGNNEAANALALLYAKLEMSQALWKKQAIDASRLNAQARAAISTLKKERAKHFATIRTELGYDTNINISPGQGAINDFEASENIDTDANDEQATLFAAVDGTYSYRNRAKSEGLIYGADAKMHLQGNEAQPLYNLGYGKAAMGVGYGFNSLLLYLPVELDYLYYLEQSLFSMVGAKPQLDWMVAKHSIIRLQGGYHSRAYSSEQQGRSDTIGSASLAYYYIVGASFAYASLAFDSYSATEATPLIYTDKTFAKLLMGANYALNKWQYRGQLMLQNGSYADKVVNDDAKRKDFFYLIRLEANRQISKHWQGAITLEHQNNHSNYSLATYNKNIISAAVIWNY